MSEVWVRRVDAERGSLPPRCARTGTRCISRWARRPSPVAAAVEWWAWTALWPRHRGDAADPVVLPLLPGRQRWWTSLSRLRDATAVLVPAAAIAALLLGGLAGRAAAWTSAAALAVHVVVAVVGQLTTVEVRPDVTGAWVRLRRVHPAFAAAVADALPRPAAAPIPRGEPSGRRADQPGGARAVRPADRTGGP